MARRLRGLSMDELVARMDTPVSKMALSKYERGVACPSQQVAESLARALDVPLSFLGEPLRQVTLLAFRFGEESPDRQYYINTLRPQLEERIAAEQLSGATMPLVRPRRRTIRSCDDAERAAISLRRLWQTGTQPLVSCYELLEMHGVRVLEFYDENEYVDGLSFWTGDNQPFVFVNLFNNKTVERKRFTALHELAHLFFRLSPLSQQEFLSTTHPKGMKAPDVERLANHFASAMLLPSTVTYHRFGTQRDTIHLDEAISVRCLYGISISAIYYRLFALGIISYDYRNIFYNTILPSNRMEDGWGLYPIPETADRLSLLEKRLKEEKSDCPQ